MIKKKNEQENLNQEDNLISNIKNVQSRIKEMDSKRDLLTKKYKKGILQNNDYEYFLNAVSDIKYLRKFYPEVISDILECIDIEEKQNELKNDVEEFKKVIGIE